MAGLVFDDRVSPYGLTYAELVGSEIRVHMNDTLGQLKKIGDSVRYRLDGAFRAQNIDGKRLISRVNPLTEIITLSTIAHPQPNQWIQHKISRCLLDKDIIRPTAGYINERADYLAMHHPELPQTRNMRILAPHYALYLAANRAQALLLDPALPDYKKVIALYPFVIASLSSLPLDVTLLDPDFKNRTSLHFANGIYESINREALTEDQAMLLQWILHTYRDGGTL